MNRTPVDDWQQLSALYEQADALDAIAQKRWLDELYGRRHPLAAQLRQMLEAKAEVQVNGFLGGRPRLADAPDPSGLDWCDGSRIGSYRLVRRIGRGGMAEVWLAQRDDGAFKRQVAIKLLFRQPGSSELDSFARRFARERDILASLDHPHIAGLHDAGVTPGGQPWLALEYVEGETLLAWSDGQGLTVEERLKLFRQVLMAVQHAHANLVIHRDLKPGNILVTPRGEVRLLDFGIAKLMEPEGGASAETELTRIAGRPMTPQYAAPEQLLGQPLTTACDVYALGVVLYELLCGERPYELKTQSIAQLEAAILEADPRAPSRRALAEPIPAVRRTTMDGLRKTLDTDLDAIVLRALAKTPSQRYGSVEAFGADIDRWLAHEPVEARAPSRLYRAGKFVRRHTVSVSLSVVAISALIAITAVAVVAGLQARDESERAVAARDFMLGIFARANQEKARGADITARDLLETGLKDVLTRLSYQPRLQAELLKGIAGIQSDMGEYVTADKTLKELVRIEHDLHHPRDESMAGANQAFNAMQMNDLRLAESLLDTARAVRNRPLDDPELNARLAEVAAYVMLQRGTISLAASELRTAWQAASRKLGPRHLRTFELGHALSRAEAENRHYDEALAILERLAATARDVQGLSHGEAAGLDWDRVLLLVKAGRFAQAEEVAEEALGRCVADFGSNEQSCRFLLLYTAETLFRLGRLDEARRFVPQLRAMESDATLPFLKVQSMLLDLKLLAELPDSADLHDHFDRVRAFGQSGTDVRVDPTFKSAALLLLAELSLRDGDAVKASDWAAAASGVLGSLDAGIPTQLANIAALIQGVSLERSGQFDLALSTVRRAIASEASELGENHPTTLLFGLNEARILAELGDGKRAYAMALATEPTLRSALGANTPAYRNVASFLESLRPGQDDEAASAHGPPARPPLKFSKAQLFFK